MSKRKSRRARKKFKAPRQRPAQRGQKAAGEVSNLNAILDQKIAEQKARHEEAKAKAEVAVLYRDYNVRDLRDQIAVKVVQKDWREKVLGWKEETPSQLGRLRNAVLRPVIKDQDWQKQFKTFIETLDPEKWSTASTDNLNRLADPDSFWEAAGITCPEVEPYFLADPDSFWEAAGITRPEIEPHFYWRATLTTLLLGALRAHSRERERERANPGAEL